MPASLAQGAVNNGAIARAIRCAVVVLAIAGCATKPPKEAETPKAEEALPIPAVPEVTRGEFTLEADKLDTWNAVGQIMVNTPGLEYKGRSQMLDLYDITYRGTELLILTKALLLSDTIKRTTTRVTATSRDGKPIDSDAAADLLAQLQQKLPEAIVDVQKRQAAEAKAKKDKGKKKSSKSKKKAK